MKKFFKLSVCTSLLFSAFAAPTLAASALPTSNVKAISPSQVTDEHTLHIQEDEMVQKVFEAAPAMDPYITKNFKGQYFLNEDAKKIVDADVYAAYERGVKNLNAALNPSPGPGQFTPNVTSQTYWWGIAWTYNNAEAKAFASALQAGAISGSAMAGIAAFVPGGQIPAIISIIESLGAGLIANSITYANRGNGVVLNVHWLPVPFYNVDAR